MIEGQDYLGGISVAVIYGVNGMADIVSCAPSAGRDNAHARRRADDGGDITVLGSYTLEIRKIGGTQIKTSVVGFVVEGVCP